MEEERESPLQFLCSCFLIPKTSLIRYRLQNARGGSYHEFIITT